jgi:hypothetical protein
VKTYEVCIRHPVDRELSWHQVDASDLAAAVAGFYAMHGPASGGTLALSQIVSIVEAEEGQR